MQAGAAAALVAAVNEAVRAGHAGALEKACRALANLTAGDAAIKAALVQASAAAVLVAAVRFGDATDTTKISATVALQRLGFNGPY